MSHSIPPEELKSLMKSDSLLLLDVRRKADHDADPETIPGATWHNPEQVGSWGRALSKERRVVVYCVKGGSVSQSITTDLITKGVTTQYIEGGLKAWREFNGQ